MKSSASESIRNACFNLERLSRSSRPAQPGISPLGRLWNGFDLRSNLIHRRLSTSQLPILDPPSPVTWFTSFLSCLPTPYGLPPRASRGSAIHVFLVITYFVRSLSKMSIFRLLNLVQLQLRSACESIQPLLINWVAHNSSLVRVVFPVS